MPSYEFIVPKDFFDQSVFNRNEKAVNAIRQIGGAVLNGGVTTLIVIVLMSFSNSYPFLTLSKVRRRIVFQRRPKGLSPAITLFRRMS